MGGKGSKEGKRQPSTRQSRKPASAPANARGSSSRQSEAQTREQMIELENRYGEIHVSTYQHGDGDRKFKVTDISDEDNKVEGFIVVRYPDLLFVNESETQEQMKWPIKFLRGYGQNDGLFSFETGRKCPTGSAVYFFEVKDETDIFAELNLIVESYNHGVGGDRYDHIPAGGMGRTDSTYSALDTNRGQDWGPDSTYAVANHGGGGGRNEPQETYAVANHSASAKGRADQSQDLYAVANHSKTGEGGDDQETYAVANHGSNATPEYGGDTYATAQHGGGGGGGSDLYATANHEQQFGGFDGDPDVYADGGDLYQEPV